MKKILTAIFTALRSKETLEKVWYFTKGKDPSELKKKITKDDIIPIVLSIMIAFGFVFGFSLLFKLIVGCR